MRPTLRRLVVTSAINRRSRHDESAKVAWSRRLRMLLRHTWILSIATLLALSGATAFAYYVFSQPTHLRVAVGPPDSDDVRAVEAIAGQLKRDRTNFRLRVIVKPGPAEAAKAVDSNEADLAVVRRDLGMSRNGGAIAIMRKNVVVLIVPAAAPEAPREKADTAKSKPAKGKAAKKGTESKPAKQKEKEDDDSDKPKIGDLVGKRIGVVGRSQANIDLLKVILRQYGVAPENVIDLGAAKDAKALPTRNDQITVVHFDPYNVGTEMRDTKVDAIMAVGPVGSTITSAAIAAASRGKQGPAFLAITASEAIAQRYPIYNATEIKAGAFGGSPANPEDDVDTISVLHYLVARRALDDQMIGDFTKTLFSIRQSLTAEFTAENGEMTSPLKIEAPSTDKDAMVALHPGASAYFTGDQKTFFDRYSDLMYWGLMLFSFSGTAIAGLVGLTKVDDRMRRLRVLERLLALTREARAAESVEALGELQTETDNILGKMIREVENDTLDEAALMAFSVSFEQAQIAISDRRAALSGQPGRASAHSR